MATPIRITVGETVLRAELGDGETARLIAEALPLRGQATLWGDEIYFGVPVTAELESDAQEAVEVGDLAYWPPGSAFCIFYGRTPVSTSTQIRPASAVSVVGRIQDDPTVLKGSASGVQVTIEAIAE